MTNPIIFVGVEPHIVILQKIYKFFGAALPTFMLRESPEARANPLLW
jgi:hypothetical protein